MNKERFAPFVFYFGIGWVIIGMIMCLIGYNENSPVLIASGIGILCLGKFIGIIGFCKMEIVDENVIDITHNKQLERKVE